MIYTLGIIFSENFEKVLLIKKTKPDWQKGNYNFPGGKLEKEEDIFDCVKREIFEECNINTLKGRWHYIGQIINENLEYSVEILTYIYRKIDGKVLSPTEEKNKWFNINHLPKNIVSNLSWLVPFAKNWWIQGNHDNLSFGTFEYAKGD